MTIRDGAIRRTKVDFAEKIGDILETRSTATGTDLQERS
jgi:hypothetical protein